MTTDKSPIANVVDSGAGFIELIDAYLEELSELSMQVVERNRFYQLLCHRLQFILDASEVGVWVAGPGPVCVPAVIANPPPSNGRQLPRPNAMTVEEFNRQIDGRELFSAGDQVARRESGLVFSAGMVATEQEPRVLRIVLETAVDPWMPKLCQDLVTAIADIATNYERRLLVDRQQQRLAQLKSFVSLLRNAGSTLDWEPFGFHASNDVRHMLSADRVWLFDCSGRLRLVACSGVNDVNPGSRVLHQVRDLAQEAVRNNRNVFYSKDQQAEPSGRRMRAYLTAAAPEGLYVSLLRPQRQAIGVLVVEYFALHERLSVISGLTEIVPAIESSMQNVVRFARLPFRSILGVVAWLLDQFSLRKLPHSLIGIGIVAVAMWLAVTRETDFLLDVQGQVRPMVERHVFAPADGTVDAVKVDYGDRVQAQQEVIVLVNKDYELRLDELQNELNTARKKLETNQLLMAQVRQEKRDGLFLAQVSAEIEQNRLTLDSITKNIDRLLARKRELTVQAPIGGQVISRDVHLTLYKRPVIRGSRLLTIADTTARWQIVFEIPDRQLGYLLQAKQKGHIQDWNIEYRLHTNLEDKFTAQILEVDQHNIVGADGHIFARAFVPLEGTERSDLRVGQSVSGRIDCGRRSWWFVGTRDIRDFLRSQFLWMH